MSFFSVFVAVIVLRHVIAGRIALDSNRGYVDTVIAINDAVEESDFPNLLDTIQTEFTLASTHLHTATRYGIREEQ